MNFKSIQKGIVTSLLQESKNFYTQTLGFQIKFENDWFLLLTLSDNPEFEIAFMLPNQEQVRKDYFRKEYSGSGVWIILESKDVQKDYETMKSNLAPIDLFLTEEEWGDVHFTLVDPNGIGIDIVQAKEVEEFQV
ncbi:VOC family protein [Leptospira sp. 201903071]|uniref:VOC family protein n=1 Tax=Leptospira ainazelensis TaxID=2810034 RepID=UPI0019653105|nr:VOC family protein [Leptospira ainazelensis]MBM9498749.1 VOC family protein [Leptospira ainazelensis]